MSSWDSPLKCFGSLSSTSPTPVLTSKRANLVLLMVYVFKYVQSSARTTSNVSSDRARLRDLYHQRNGRLTFCRRLRTCLVVYSKVLFSVECINYQQCVHKCEGIFYEETWLLPNRISLAAKIICAGQPRQTANVGSSHWTITVARGAL